MTTENNNEDMIDALRRRARVEKIKRRKMLIEFYINLVAKGKIIETNPFNAEKPVDEFLKEFGYENS